MSYQVLARKYRPTLFRDLEGQKHVLQALINALDSDRLHHAYLFTGTRGVGKTTIARILARCLNCELGVTSTPCGACNNCVEITEGRSIDLIEVDAASRTGVDDMRELLDNVQYMPTAARFKVYLIDEVHMLSRSSFNAMLKTLEEPPDHVKFLFATTDPKKLPITVLSRCLQFNLKNLSPEQIVRYLGIVLEKEAVRYDEKALWQLGLAADGSMRDALSLTDQAISYGGNEIRDASVKSMLGTIDHQDVFDLIDSVIMEDGTRLLERVAAMSEYAPDFVALLDDILSVLHRMAIAQAVPKALDNAQGDLELVLTSAAKITAEHVQLLYQIALIGQRDLALAPMPRIGFEMVLLRMMSFSLDDGDRTRGHRVDLVSTNKTNPRTSDSSSENGQTHLVKSGSEVSPAAEVLSTINGGGRTSSLNESEASAVTSSIKFGNSSAEQVKGVDRLSEGSSDGLENNPVKSNLSNPGHDRDSAKEDVSTTKLPKPLTEAKKIKIPEVLPPELVPPNWAEILKALPLSGVAASLASNCQLFRVDKYQCILKLSDHHASLWNETYEKRIAGALSDLYNQEVMLSIEVGEIIGETPAEYSERLKREDFEIAVAEMESNESVQQLINNFNGRLDRESIAPRKN